MSNLLTVTIRDQIDFNNRKLPFIEGGGFFVETPRQYKVNDRVFVIIELEHEKRRLTTIGTVAWVVPKLNYSTFKPGIGLYMEPDNNEMRDLLK
jgi:type IV pilus assembly protein PilZ